MEDMCVEQRVYYRLLSGLHTHISTQVFWNYEKVVDANDEIVEWKPNSNLWNRFMRPFPDRLQNLHFVSSAHEYLCNVHTLSGIATRTHTHLSRSTVQLFILMRFYRRRSSC
jgi:hypothetical protein